MYEESQEKLFPLKIKRRLQLSIFEQVMIGAMLVALLVAGVDAMDGQKVGKSDALTIAKLQGQQELMAAIGK